MQKVSQELAIKHGLTSEEYNKIIKLMGRNPNLVELGIFSAMWNEHCSYKSSRIWLQTLPTKNKYVIQGLGRQQLEPKLSRLCVPRMVAQAACKPSNQSGT